MVMQGRRRAGAAVRAVLGELAHDMTATEVIRDLVRERDLLQLEARSGDGAHSL